MPPLHFFYLFVLDIAICNIDMTYRTLVPVEISMLAAIYVHYVRTNVVYD